MPSNNVTVINYHPQDIRLRIVGQADLDRKADQTDRAREADRRPMTAVQTVVLKGAKRDVRFHPSENKLLGMAGVTEVDADFWDVWKKQNERSPLLTGGFLQDVPNAAAARGVVREMENERSGFEGVDQKQTGPVTAAV